MAGCRDAAAGARVYDGPLYVARVPEDTQAFVARVTRKREALQSPYCVLGRKASHPHLLITPFTSLPAPQPTAPPSPTPYAPIPCPQPWTAPARWRRWPPAATRCPPGART